MGVKPEDVAIETFGNKYGGHWIAHVPALEDPERGRAILTSSKDIYKLCRWKSRLRIIVEGT